MLFNFLQSLKQIFWDPISGITFFHAVIMLLPALVFDLALGFLLRVGTIIYHRVRAAIRDKRGKALMLSLEGKLESLSAQVQADRNRLAELRLAADFRAVEVMLRQIRLGSAELAEIRNQLQALTVTPYQPRVSIIVPCHNSEEVIEDTLVSLCNLEYPGLEIIVVDDGSTDLTAKVVDDFIRAQTARLVPKAADGGIPQTGNECHIGLVRRHHTSGLKAGAVNFGLSFASGDVIIVVDDDTVIASDAIAWIVQPLTSDRVAACGGNIKVGAEKRSIVVRLQELEYLQTMEIGREWQNLALKRVFVISGSFGAFKREYLARIGEYDIVTVTEDLDVTWKLYRLRGEVRFSSQAEAITVVPTGLKTLARQRRRWDFGMLQTLSRHWNLFFDRRFGSAGMFLLPEVLFSELLLPVIRPFYMVVIIVWAEIFHVVHISMVLLTTFYFYLFMEALTIFTVGMLSSRKRIALRIYYAPLMILYRTFLAVVKAATTLRFLSGKKHVW